MKTLRKTKKGLEYEVVEGSVLAALGLPDSTVTAMKTRLAIDMQRFIKENKLTQARVAEMTRLTQPSVSALMNMRLDSFSLERLIESATQLGITVKSTEAVSAATSTVRATMPVRRDSVRSLKRLNTAQQKEFEESVRQFQEAGKRLEEMVKDYQRQGDELLQQYRQFAGNEQSAI